MGDKVTLSPLTVEDNSSYETGLNQRLDTLADEFDNVMYRDGSTDLSAPLNLNGKRLLNLGAPTSMSDAVRLSDIVALTGTGVIEVAPDFSQNDIDAATLSLVEKAQQSLNVEDFRGDSDTDLSAIVKGIAAVKARGGGRLQLGLGKVYNLGNLGSTTPAMLIEDAENVVIDGQFATLTWTSTVAGTATRAFTVRNSNGMRFENLFGQDLGFSATPFSSPTGGAFVELDGTDGEVNHVSFSNCIIEDMVYGVLINGSANRVRHVTIDPSCSFTGCYYGLNCQENGDFVIGGFASYNCVRPYFVYGVRNHKLKLNIYHDGFADAGDAACLIKNYILDTADIDLDLYFAGSAAYEEELVLIEHQNDRADSRIDNVRIQLHVDRDILIPHSSIALGFRSYSEAGVEETTTTTKQFNSITLLGDLSGFTNETKIKSFVTPNKLVNLTLAPSLAGVDNINIHPTGMRLKTGKFTEFYLRRGDLTVATNRVKIPVHNHVNRSFAFRATVYAVNDPALEASATHTINTYNILGYNVGGTGGVAIEANGAFGTASEGTAPTVTWEGNPGSATEYVTLIFADDDIFDNINSQLHVSVEWLDGIEA